MTAVPILARIVASGMVGRAPLVSPSVQGLSASAFETPEYGRQYGLGQIDAAGAYARGFTGLGQRVAVVDSGLDSEHPEFAGRIASQSRNFDIGNPETDDFEDHDPPEQGGGHGTFSAGLVAAARNGSGLHGVAFDAEVLALRAVGGGRDTNAAVDYATAQGIKILNGSYGPNFDVFGAGVLPIQPFERDEAFKEYQSIKRAVDSGMLLVFAAGNDGQSQPEIARNPSGASLFPYIKPENAGSGVYQFVKVVQREPLALEAIDQSEIDFSDVAGSIVTVVAVDRDNRIASFSNRCGVAAAWCIAAGGKDVFSTTPLDQGGSGNNSGTSFAAPQVSGAAAVLRQAFPFMTAPQLAQTMFTTATDLGDPETYGWGLLNLGRAIDGPGQFSTTWTVDTQGFDGRFSNPISGPGGLVKQGLGTLELAGANTYAGATEIRGGTLAINGSVASGVTVGLDGVLRGSGRIDAALTSSGVVRPGNSAGTLTVAGPVSFSGTNLLVLDIDGTGTGSGAGHHARLLATGPAGAMAVGGVLVPILRGIAGEATNAYTPMLGTRLAVLGASAGLTGSFDGLLQPSAGLAAGTRFDALYRANGLDLVTTPARYGALAALGLPQNGNERAVGAALDTARPAAGVRPDAARGALYDALYAAGPATLPSALASLSGQSYGDALMADLAARRLVATTIDRHLTGIGGPGLGLRAGDSGGPLGPSLDLQGRVGAAQTALAPGEGRFWGEGLYGLGGRGRDAEAGGARFDAGGLIVGIDRQIGANSLVGVSAHYLRSEGRSDGTGRSLGRFSTDSYGGAVYGATRLGALELRGSAGAAYADARISRDIAVGSLVRGATGTPTGVSAGVAAFAGWRIATGLSYDLVPEAGFSYDHLNRGAVVEQGGIGAPTVTTRDVNALRSLVGGRLTTALVPAAPGDLRFDLRGYWSHELADNAALTVSNLYGVPFAAVTSRPSRDGAVLGAAISGAVGAGLRIQAAYTGELRGRADAHLFSAGLTANW